jgi:hypothetical protein
MSAGDVNGAAPAGAKRPGSLRGVLVCLAMFAFGGLVLWGLFLVPRPKSPASPDLPWGRPTRPVKLVSLDFAGNAGLDDPLVKQVRDHDPDFVLVQNIRFDDVLPLADGLGMARSYYPQLFQRADPRSKDMPGALLLSKHALYDAKPMVLDPDPRRTEMRGVEAVAVVDGVRFVVASGAGGTDEAQRALDEARTRWGRPPIVLATGFVRPGSDERTYHGNLNPVLAVSQEVRPGGPVVPGATVFADPGWTMTTGGTAPSPDGKMIIFSVELKESMATTPTASQPSR